MNISHYLDQVRHQYDSGHATEHSYRPALYDLFKSIDPSITVINEPKRGDAGMVDFLFERDGVPFGWAEAKDIDKDVIKLKGYSVDQRKRYEKAYPNLIYTNGIDFEFIRDGQQVHFVSIADFPTGLQPNPDAFEELERQLKLFAEQKPISIRSAAKLAEMMAAKAAIIKDEISIALAEDPGYRTGLGGQYKSFKANLLPALEPDEFADIYAETITYGMFAARFHDETPDTFSRQEALENLPASNPFLKGLFEYIAGAALPKRLRYIVDDLVQVMRASDPHALFRDFGKFTARNDPFIHFYEDFLAAYNPKKRKSRGVWYTPEPVVDFIVRAVDDVLKSEFGLPDGLADTSKVTVDWDTGTNDAKSGKPITIKKEVHKVQILDPATGTGTFLAKAVQLISDRVKARAPGKWSGYVEQDLLPRLHGFELLMASYAMCHMKLDMQLAESGYKPSATPPRLSVWLTNALEPAEREVRDLFFQPLADEARGASEVKRQTPIMCVIGNPPYSGESSNKGDHIMGLMEAYKREPGGKEKLKERNSKYVNDDYVKFIRMAENLIAKNASGGVLGFITNHGYLDNPTFRGMRWHLLKTFDKIWILDLHGNAKKQEIAPDGTADKNVFDIQQGVSLIIAARHAENSGKLAEVVHGEFWGTRKEKSDALWRNTFETAAKSKLAIEGPHYYFIPRNSELGHRYAGWFHLSELFNDWSIGTLTKRDRLSIDFTKNELRQKLLKFADPALSEIAAGQIFDLKQSDNDAWDLPSARQVIRNQDPSEFIREEWFRPFEKRWVAYHPRLIARQNRRVLSNFDKANIGLITVRQLAGLPFFHSFVSDDISDQHFISTRTKEGGVVSPLYLYPDETTDQSDAFAPQHRTLNLDPKLYAAICAAAGIDPADTAMAREADGPHPNPSPEGKELYDFRKPTGDARPSEVKVFDYIYGVLHAPNYRATFAEFLKIDFPRIPYPPSPEIFAHVSEKGEALRRLHLMEDAAIGETPYPYHGPDNESDDDESGDDVVAAGFPKWEAKNAAHAAPAKAEDARTGVVKINPTQYFDNVPEIAWNFHIGGYQPAQKWLKDRKGRVLSWDDIGHYQKIIKILSETDRIMQEIDLPLGEDEG